MPAASAQWRHRPATPSARTGLLEPPPLRPDQSAIVEEFVRYAAAISAGSEPSCWCHIVLPPRTGKTVIAAHIARRLGVQAAFVVPTRVLVAQTRREFARHAPDVAVGVFYGDEKRAVDHGMNVTTYATLQTHERIWCKQLADAQIIFVDEAHHALTSSRHQVLVDAFGPDAIRIALTATPDYDQRRRLDAWFPRRIARMELRDALANCLLAPAQVHIAEVDVDGSTVEILAGEYRPDQLSRLLSQGPVFAAALRFRLLDVHRDVPCLIACLSRQQADDLVGYFVRHQPPGRPAPGLILGETLGLDRERILDEFEAGRIDTIVQVGVLIEGWTSARCKLLIDLAPGRSQVRATQKYFRVLTRQGDRMAHLVVLVPRDLPRPPVLPMDLLLEPGEMWTAGQTIRHVARSRPMAVESATVSPIRGVKLVQRLLICARLGRPSLDPTRPEDVRQVLLACPDFDAAALPGARAFDRLYLHHPLFSGTGRTLLRWLGVRWGAYDLWLAGLFRDEVAARLLGVDPDTAIDDDTVPLDGLGSGSLGPDGSFALRDPALNPEEALLHQETLGRVFGEVNRLSEREAWFIRCWAGFEDGEGDGSVRAIAEAEDLSTGRVRQIIQGSLARCRWKLYEEECRVPAHRGRDSVGMRQLGFGTARGDDPALGVARMQWRRLDDTGARATLRRLINDSGGHPWASALMVEMATTPEHWDALGPHLDAVADCRIPAVQLDVGRALHARNRYAECLRVLKYAGAVSGWPAADALLRSRGDAAALASIGTWPDAGDLPVQYHRILLLHRLGQPTGEAMLHAFGRSTWIAWALLRRDVALGGGLRRDERDYVEATTDLWHASPGALERLRAWVDAKPVQRWLTRVQRSEIPRDPRVWGLIGEVVRQMAE